MRHPELTTAERRTLARLLRHFRQGREMPARDFQTLLALRRKASQRLPLIFSEPQKRKLARQAKERSEEWSKGWANGRI